MNTWPSATCEANGTRIHYLRTGGDGPPVVLLHGLMGSGACWTPLARALEAEFDVVMPDARGHGDSAAPEHGYGYDDHARDVADLIHALDLSRPVLLGHSMGGMTAALLASRRVLPLRGLVLVDPTFLSPARQREVHDSDVAAQHRRALASTKAELVAQARARSPHRALALLELQAEARLKTHPRALDVLTPPNPAYHDVVSKIDVPSLLVVGDSPVVTLDMATELRSANAHVHIQRIDDAGHGLPFDQPERLAEVVLSFLRRLHRVSSCALLALALLAFVATARARDVAVDDASALAAAITNAKAGDLIVLSPGTYRIATLRCSATGSPAAPIIVRSATPLAAKLQIDAAEGFAVTGAHWRFEGLDVTGACAKDDDCEHAFHVTGAADGFVLRESRVRDFNAQLKVNATQVAGTWRTPNGGLIEGNELADTHARNTSKPVTKLNIDTGDGWVVRANYLHDAHKAGGDTISYAAFMKSGGSDGVFERNLVICSRDDTTGGVRIGLSFGGGGTGAQFCAPRFDAAVPCDPEHTRGTMKNNVIIGCSDVGIYLNKAHDTKLLFNTLIATAGIDFRFASSTGEADGNVLAGKIRAREGGTFTAKTNLTDVTSFADWYLSPATGDLRRKGDLAALIAKAAARAEVTDDYCGRARPGTARTLGALEHTLGDCDTTRPPVARSESDAGVAASDGGTEPPLDAAAAPPDDAGSADGDASQGESAPRRESGGGCSTSDARSPSGWVPLVLALMAVRGALRRRAPPTS